jgi:hypothetical protein
VLRRVPIRRAGGSLSSSWRNVREGIAGGIFRRQTMITAQQLCEDDWALWRTLRQAALAEAPGAFGSTLAEWTGAGDTEARWRARLVTVPFNVVARLDDRPTGMASATAPSEGEVELISMWVAPHGRACGVGDARHLNSR